MQFEGVTIFVNSELVLELAHRASLHDFAGIIVLCLHGKLPRELSIAEFYVVARDCMVLCIIPQNCAAEHIGIGCNRYGIPGLIVNYTDGSQA